ncbi:MAG: metalloregulator ArsR/SmtB family transcription factor [Collinsella sp.]|nr:metalloregulator ArsR/SmtB family transcription factor [Collinsella sp.]
MSDRIHPPTSEPDPVDGQPGGAPEGPTTNSCTPEDLPDEELLYDLADLFKVFSDTTRIKILYALMGRELAVGDIAEATCASQSAVSHQLRTLKQSHLVKFRRDGRSILYSLADDHVYTMLNQGMSHICE